MKDFFNNGSRGLLALKGKSLPLSMKSRLFSAGINPEKLKKNDQKKSIAPPSQPNQEGFSYQTLKLKALNEATKLLYGGSASKTRKGKRGE